VEVLVEVAHLLEEKQVDLEDQVVVETEVEQHLVHLE
jgi:hypothetical protein